uniref:Acetyl-coenzyme A transporter 1 n=1 Tax=Sipha flava TaxID=143950 RepID=A0A2S2QWK0_9HEMI
MKGEKEMEVTGVDDKGRPNRNVENPERTRVKPNLKGDMLNVALLVLLYTLQGIPIGISSAIRTYVQNKKVSYGQQAKFSMVDLPYSLKLLLAPLIDTLYSRQFGKRKTWLVPIQCCLGLALIFVGSNINEWLLDNNVEMTTLTCVFFCVNVLASTQDIIIDGWSLTLLRRENVPYASTCNTSGQTLGIALGYMFFILFESEEFCNKWLRFTDQKGGIITMKGYLYFWGIIFCVVAVLITIFKKEKLDPSDTVVGKTKICDTYQLLWKILHLPTIQKFTIVMLTYEVAFSSLGTYVSNPKFMEYGVEKEGIVVVDMTLIPIKIITPLIIARFTTGPRPLEIFYKTVPYRLIMGIMSAVLVYYTHSFINDKSNNGYLNFFLIYELHRVLRLMLSVFIYLGVQAFFLRISDPRIGGTYMALLNTVWYLGVAMARTIALGMLNVLTIKRCSTDESNLCWTKAAVEDCELHSGGDCITVIDGYFVEVFICTISGVIWYLTLRRILKNLQSTETDEWQVNNVRLAIADKNNGSDTCCKLPDIVDCNSPKSN